MTKQNVKLTWMPTPNNKIKNQQNFSITTMCSSELHHIGKKKKKCKKMFVWNQEILYFIILISLSRSLQVASTSRWITAEIVCLFETSSIPFLFQSWNKISFLMF